LPEAKEIMLNPNTRQQQSDLLTVGQAATLLNVHANTVRRWAQQGVLHAYRIGTRRDRRFRRSDVDGLLRGEVERELAGELHDIPAASD
jgi:excisionase family DNA binding protein